MGRESRGWILVLLLVAASLIAVGCGDDDEETGSAEPSAEAPEAPAEPAAPTKKEYIAEADQICKKASARGQGVLDSLNDALTKLASGQAPEEGSATANAASDRFAKLAGIRDAATKELEELEPPAGGPPKEYLKRRDISSEVQRDTAKAFATFADELTQESSDAAAALLEKLNELGPENRKLAERYGFKECGQLSK